MASFDVLPSGKIRVRFVLDGRRRSRIFGTKAAARDFVSDLGTDDTPNASSIRLDAWVAEWFPGHAATVKPSTAWIYKRSFNAYVLPNAGYLSLSELTPKRLREWQAALVRDSYAPATIKLARTAFGLALSAAVVDELIPTNPFDRVAPVAVRQIDIRILTEEEIHALAEAIGPRWRALILVAGYCGLRMGELCALRLKDVDLELRQLHVRRTLTMVDKGALVEGSPKTASSERSIAMPQSLVVDLRRHIDAGYSNETRVFTSPHGDQLTPVNFRNRDWAKALERTGIGHLRPHDLRHTAVSMWIRSGASPKLVARRAGHSSVSYVLDTYGHLFDDEDGQLADKLEVQWLTGAAELDAARTAAGIDLL